MDTTPILPTLNPQARAFFKPLVKIDLNLRQ